MPHGDDHLGETTTRSARQRVIDPDRCGAPALEALFEIVHHERCQIFQCLRSRWLNQRGWMSRMHKVPCLWPSRVRSGMPASNCRPNSPAAKGLESVREFALARPG